MFTQYTDASVMPIAKTLGILVSGNRQLPAGQCTSQAMQSMSGGTFKIGGLEDALYLQKTVVVLHKKNYCKWG